MTERERELEKALRDLLRMCLDIRAWFAKYNTQCEQFDSALVRAESLLSSETIIKKENES